MQLGTGSEEWVLQVVLVPCKFCVQHLNHQLCSRIHGPYSHDIWSWKWFWCKGLFIVFIISEERCCLPVPTLHSGRFQWYWCNRLVSHLRCSENVVMGGSGIHSLQEGGLGGLGAYPGPWSLVAVATLLLCQGCFSLWAGRSSLPCQQLRGLLAAGENAEMMHCFPDGSSKSLHFNPTGNSGPAEAQGN